MDLHIKNEHPISPTVLFLKQKQRMSRHYNVTITLFLLFIISTSNAFNPNNGIYQFLAPQNAARSALGMRPLVWDQKLARYAQWYANQRRWDCELKHSNGAYGENIFWGSGNRWSPAQASAAWVAERRWYNYWSNSCGGGQECGHYTQIVWRGTRRVGCARVNCFGGRGVFMTCNYDPPGNYIGAPFVLCLTRAILPRIRNGYY